MILCQKDVLHCREIAGGMSLSAKLNSKSFCVATHSASSRPTC